MEEIWKAVKGYEGLYEVSDQGRCRRIVDKFLIPKTPTIKAYTLRSNYLGINVYKNNKQKNILIHRMVAEAFIPNPLNKPYVNHKDGNKLNNYVDNLEWVTPKENSEHAALNGLTSKGSKHILSKLDETKVTIIRRMIEEHCLTKEIGIIFGVSKATIDSIKYGKSWKHVN